MRRQKIGKTSEALSERIGHADGSAVEGHGTCRETVISDAATDMSMKHRCAEMRMYVQIPGAVKQRRDLDGIYKRVINQKT